MKYIISIVLGYLLGSINGAMIVSKIKGCDIRNYGSGNAGTTNVLRVFGKKAAAFTLLVDLLKGVVAVLLVILIWHNTTLDVLAGAAAVLGHNFPVFFKFKGGKGVATSLGVIMIINWQIGLICLVFALILMILTRIVSLGSVAAAILFPVLTLFITENYSVPGDYRIFGILLGVFVCFNHRANIKRLLKGEEKRIF